MINKRSFIFNTLSEALKFKISADAHNTSYRLGSFSPDADIVIGEPDIPYYAEILIRETNQIWRCNQFWLNDIKRTSDTDIIAEKAERIAADELLQRNIEDIDSRVVSIEHYATDETQKRTEADEQLKLLWENQQSAIASLGLRVDGLAGNLITMEEYRNIKPKLFQTYYVARDDADKLKLKCWRIYLRNQLIGEFESNGKLTLPKFPMRFPFRFA